MEENATILTGREFNLSDFALFLSVMKNPRAYRCVLSIFMEEPERAIRLDAWAKSKDHCHFNMEMKNDSKGDDVRKRSRYYQGLLDSPILKSGKETKYKHLPSTVIIFITQEDIFGKDLAKYTFTEQCEEVPGMKLGDGTKKIFLNMTSKNGTPELISMLQYMKKTSIDNPEIQVKDSRILELDKIVAEVKSSEEWETVKMNILEIDLEEGKRIGIERGLQQKLTELVEKKIKKGYSIEEIAELLEENESVIRDIVNKLQEK